MLSLPGHNSEAGLDAHDSGNKEQQKTFSFVTVNHELQPNQVPFI